MDVSAEFTDAAAVAVAGPPVVSEATASEEANSERSHEEFLLWRAERLISKVIAAETNPNPRHLHALASILEEQESRCMQESGSSNNARSSHPIGKLINLVRENDEFYELISSRLLSESRYNISIRAAACRLLLSCPSNGMYPHVFDDTVVDNFKSWVVEDILTGSADVCNWKRELGRSKPTDFELLKTYATGLLAMSLAGGTKVVEDILASGLSAKLMRYLRMRILGEANSSQKDAVSQSEVKHSSVSTCTRGREENKGRPRQVLDGLKITDECLSGDQSTERDREKNTSMRQAHEEECWHDGDELLKIELAASSTNVVYGEADNAVEDECKNRDLLDEKLKFGERQVARPVYEDAAENVRDDSARRRTSRGWPRSRAKGRIPEATLENEKVLLSPSSGLRLNEMPRSSADKSPCKSEEGQINFDSEKNLVRAASLLLSIEEDTDDRFTECLVGSRDISDSIKKATRAAEAEARAANAPAEAIKAAGDAAAELVRSAALEVWKSTSEEDTAVLAASKAASTVVDAAIATKASRPLDKSSLDICDGLLESKVAKSEPTEDPEEFFIIEGKSLTQLREKYSILCLQRLGEYVEALGPILHEKGVDVCLAFLQRYSNDGEATDKLALLPEVLKLVSSLAAHKKFASLFVDRGGMQKLLAVCRASNTYVGLSSCLFTIGSLQGVMERVCALSSDNVYQVVELALKLLECSQELARKNAAIFLAGAFVFRAILDTFDAQDGMQKMLNLLQGAASIRSGGNSGMLGMPRPNFQNDRTSAEVLSSQEKAIAYHSCVALRQYFRAHLLLLVDSLRPNKSTRNIARGTSSTRASYRPLDISNEAMDVVFQQIQRDRKLGSAFVRARWPAIEKFLASNGHIVMLELCQAPTVERYLHDLAQYALGVLHIATFVPYGRKLTLNATLSNNRLGMAVILDAANGSGYVEPEVILPALNVLVNLVCPPPSISNKASVSLPTPQSASTNMLNGFALENRERHLEQNMSERNILFSDLNESRESGRNAGTTSCSSQTTVTSMTSGVVGDRKICLGPGAGCAGLAAQLEQGYHQAREAVRANNGIKVLLHLLHPRMPTPLQALDSIRALVCRVLLGLARDETIAHILTKLQVGKKLSELIRDLGSQASGNDHNRWQAELSQVAIELIAIVTNSGRASTLAATDAAAPTLRRIERAAIAAATPITYHSRELLLLIHEHLQFSGLTASAAALKKEAALPPLPSLLGTPLLHQTSTQETSVLQVHWPSGRAPCGFLLDVNTSAVRVEGASQKTDVVLGSSRKKPRVSLNLLLGKTQILLNSSSTNGVSGSMRSPSASNSVVEISHSGTKSNTDVTTAIKPSNVLPMKRKLTELKDPGCATPETKRLAKFDSSSLPPLFQTPSTGRRGYMTIDEISQSPMSNLTPKCTSGRTVTNPIPMDSSDEIHSLSVTGAPGTPLPQLGLQGEQLPGNMDRMTLDSLVVQYLKHQHRQCPAPITTLPPLSLLHPHVCPEPSRSLNAPANVVARASNREFGKQHRGIHLRDRQFVYSRFRPCRTCRGDVSLLTCVTFLGNSERIITGSHSGELKIFDANNGNVLENNGSHLTQVPIIQSAVLGDTQLILSSGTSDVKLWYASSLSNGPVHSFDGCKAARFSHSTTTFAALSTDSSSREVLIYDIQTCSVDLRLSDGSINPPGAFRGNAQSLVHFSPLDTTLLWNGVLWDRRTAAPLHRFDQFTDYGGGGFHPSGNEVILNSEVWDLRKFRLLRSVPSLDQTVITFSPGGNIIYAILRRNLEDITSAVHTRRARHPLYPAFRTIDATNYSDIATVPVDRCVLDFAADSSDSYVCVIAMDDHDEMFSSAKLYEIGRRRPTDDDSDPDDGCETDEDEDDEDEDEDDGADADSILETESDSGRGSESDDIGNNGDDENINSSDEEAEFNIDDVDFGGAQGILGLMPDSDDGDNDGEVSSSSGEEGHFTANAVGF